MDGVFSVANGLADDAYADSQQLHVYYDQCIKWKGRNEIFFTGDCNYLAVILVDIQRPGDIGQAAADTVDSLNISKY